ncbi:MAG: hypothetical protein NZ992_01590 [Candidatus Korarchaeum sp.]|nr:hypothetical protein [Candidatus Korarchaeum sp.]MDW8035501.1 hypothetical protein [Candidatus Korarchaeum sp.]
MEVGNWVERATRNLEDSLRGVERIGIILPPTPDGIASSVILSELCSQMGIDSEFLVSLPETSLDAVEIMLNRCDYLIFLELPPHGYGPISIAKYLYKGLMVIDHGSTEMPLSWGVSRVGLPSGGVSTSLLLYLISSHYSKENEYLSWIAVSGFSNKCSSKLCNSIKETSQFYWPNLMEENAIGFVQRALSAACFEGEEWVMIAISSLQESVDDPWWFIKGSSAAPNLLRSKLLDFEREIEDILTEPFMIEGEVGIWEVNEPYQRFALSIEANRIVKAAISFFYDPPLGLIYILAPQNIDLYAEALELLKNESEWSIFGGMGFLSMITSSEAMLNALIRFKDRLNSVIRHTEKH